MDPYISFVVAARNDNYGGNFVLRMQIFLNVWLELCNKYDLKAELVIVEWNPPENKPRLKDALAWPKCLQPSMVRIIQVPGEIHYRLPNSDRIPMFEYIAKNVGIRRAKGEYVLATNPDILFSEQMVKVFAKRSLSQNYFYRADRYDVGKEIPLNLSVHDQLRFCIKHAFRIYTIRGSIPTSKLTRLRLQLSSNLPRLSPNRVAYGLLRRAKRLFTHKQVAEDENSHLPLLHTHASGDFFLMGRTHWYGVRGYPELKSHSFIDGYACFLAVALGLQQVILKSPFRIFHQDHDRSEHSERPVTNYQKYLDHGRKMLESGNPEIFNGEDWGLGNEQLEEFAVGL